MNASSPNGSFTDREVSGEPATLAARHLTKRYDKRAVVDDVSLEVEQGEIVGLLGPNGAGKTTTFHMIVGMIRPNDGAIHLEGDEITQLPMYKRARRGVGYLAQETSVFRELTVESNLHAVLEFQSMGDEDRKARVESLIQEFGLERVRESKGYELSGGERRRTEIARALSTRPGSCCLTSHSPGWIPLPSKTSRASLRASRSAASGC
jgi:ABC-type (unclassified) transport system, ATPase component